MSDIYISELIKQIKASLNKKRYFLAGSKFMELTEYGINVNNKLLVTICSEHADIFINSFMDVEKHRKKIEEKDLNIVLENVEKLMGYLNSKFEDINLEDRNRILTMMVESIYFAEKIQYQIEGFGYRRKYITRRDFL